MSGGNLERVLRLMAEKKASDVFLSARTPILIKLHGQIMQLTDQVLSPSQPRQLLSEMISSTQMEELDETGELNLGITIPGVAIFRLSAFKQRGSVAAVFRYIPSDIPALEDPAGGLDPSYRPVAGYSIRGRLREARDAAGTSRDE